MFELKVTVTPRIGGLLALDERRRLGLPDGTFLGTDEERYSFKVIVSEAFARQFPDVYAEWNDMEIDVPTSSFLTGELIVDPDDVSGLEAGPALTEERLLHLSKVFMATPIED
jgi:hypothetical protein